MKIDYVAGLVGKATLEASDYYSSFDWAKPWFKSAEAYATDYKYSAQDQAKMTLDNMNAAKMALHIVNNNWASADAKTTASAAINAIITDLKYYNENYVIGGTKSKVKEATANDVQKKMLGGVVPQIQLCRPGLVRRNVYGTCSSCTIDKLQRCIK